MSNKMSDTKKQTKKTRKKTDEKVKKEKKQKKDEKIKQDIKQAVEKIPEFLFNKVEIQIPPQEEPQIKQAGEPQKNQPIGYQLYRARRVLMWLGVAVLAAAIFGMWAWNIASFWQDTGKGASAENSLWQKAKNSFSSLNAQLPNELQTALEQNEAKAAIKQQLETELTKAKIRDALEQKIIYEKQTANTK